jgi:hypothetical protein
MKIRPSLTGALLACVATGALFVSGCSTVSSRIENNRAAFEQLSSSDRALVTAGRIRGGMSEEAVYIAWGAPQQKATGAVHNTPTETWVYTITTTLPGYGYGGLYGPGFYGGGFYGGFAGHLGYYGRHGGRRFYGFYSDPFFDPFYYPFPETISQPVKTVSFQRGRVVAYQYLLPSS